MRSATEPRPDRASNSSHACRKWRPVPPGIRMHHRLGRARPYMRQCTLRPGVRTPPDSPERRSIATGSEPNTVPASSNAPPCPGHVPALPSIARTPAVSAVEATHSHRARADQAKVAGSHCSRTMRQRGSIRARPAGCPRGKSDCTRLAPPRPSPRAKPSPRTGRSRPLSLRRRIDRSVRSSSVSSAPAFPSRAERSKHPTSGRPGIDPNLARRTTSQESLGRTEQRVVVHSGLGADDRAEEDAWSCRWGAYHGSHG